MGNNQSSVDSIEKEMELLTTLRDSTESRMKFLHDKGYKERGYSDNRTPQGVQVPHVSQWLKDVEKSENELKCIQKNIAADAADAAGDHIQAALAKLEKSIQTLKTNYEKYYRSNAWLVLNERRIEIRVEDMMFKPSLEGQLISQTNLHRVVDLLRDDNVSVIGVWGMAGIGKTLLMKTLNYELLYNPSQYPSFDVVIYVKVSQPLDLSKIQQQIGKRLGIRNEVLCASEISARLMDEKNILIIFDNVWKGFKLCDVGIPHPEVHAGCKVILTSRDKDVFTYISKGVEVVKVHTLNEEQSLKLLGDIAGPTTNLDYIEPIARDITRECGGLPLAIKCYGLSMENQDNIIRWQCALESLRNRSEPGCPTVDKEVFKKIKKIYDSFEGESVYKGGDDIQKCFLDCTLYPKNSSIPIDPLIRSWHEKGFIAKGVNEYRIFGLDFVHRLISVSLLEQDGDDSVKMHPLVRHVAIWIAKDKSAY